MDHGSDDSAAFQATGLLALGLGQMAAEPRRGGIYVPDDSRDQLHLSAIDEGVESILSLLDRLAVHPALASHVPTF